MEQISTPCVVGSISALFAPYGGVMFVWLSGKNSSHRIKLDNQFRELIVVHGLSEKIGKRAH